MQKDARVGGRVKTLESLERVYRTAVDDAESALAPLLERIDSVELETLAVNAAIALLPASQAGWPRWAIVPVLLVAALLEWDLARQLAFLVDYGGGLYFAVVLAICAVAVGWLIGSLLRQRYRDAADDAPTARTFVAIAFIVTALILTAAVLPHITFARMVMIDEYLSVPSVIGSVMITSVPSFLGIVVAAAFEFFRQGDEDIDLRKERKALQVERAMLLERIERADAYLKQLQFTLVRFLKENNAGNSQAPQEFPAPPGRDDETS